MQANIHIFVQLLYNCKQTNYPAMKHELVVVATLFHSLLKIVSQVRKLQQERIRACN